MVLLPNTSDSGITDNLRERLHTGNIYTYIGHVLVVCNPYKWLPIYEKDVMKQHTHQVSGLVIAIIVAILLLYTLLC
jgi:myosin-1